MQLNSVRLECIYNLSTDILRVLNYFFPINTFTFNTFIKSICFLNNSVEQGINQTADVKV